MVKIIVFAFISLVLILFLKSYRPEYAMLATAAASGIILVFIISEVYSPLSKLFLMLEDYGINNELTTYLLKAFAICYLTKFATDVCADFGQTSLSGKVELAGRAAMFILSLPLISGILQTGLSLI
jgi:stage III sporulation protein AD